MFDENIEYLYERTDCTEDEEIYSFILEDAKPTYIIKNNLYPKVEAVLSTSSGDRQFQQIIGSFIDRNSNKLHTPGPQYLIPFTETDKEKYYKLFNIDASDIKKLIIEVVNNINAQADWKLLKNNPVFVLFFCCIRYYTVNKNEKGLNGALATLALAMYPSMYSKYYDFDPNPAIMQYTIDSLSNKFIIKKTKHIFGNLIASIQQSWSFHNKNIVDGADKNVVDFIMRIRNDQNSFMRKIANNYHDNHKRNLTVHTVNDSFEDNNVVDLENDTNRVESVTNKISLSIMVHGVDLRLAEASAKGSMVSVVDTRNYLGKIIVSENSDDLKSFIESILFLFLYDGKQKLESINSRQFLDFGLSIFKKTNSKDPNITNIKRLLDKWGESTGLHSATTRIPTITDYKRAFFTYFIFAIQKNN